MRDFRCRLRINVRASACLKARDCLLLNCGQPVLSLMRMRSLFLALGVLTAGARAAPSALGWRFDVKPTRSGIVALESIIVSPTLALFFDRATNDPLQIDGHSAWGALWNLESDAVTPLNVITNSFCAGGALLSNGTMVCAVPYLLE